MDFTLLDFSAAIVTPAVLICVFKLEKAKNTIEVNSLRIQELSHNNSS